MRHSGPQGRFTRVRLLDAAKEDMRALAGKSERLFIEVMRLLKKLDQGSLSPRPLDDFANSGDLTDCGKIVVDVEGEAEYRIVVREVGGDIDVVDVIAVENRLGGLPYLLAGLRMDRIEDPVRRSDAQRRVAQIRRHLEED